MVNAHFALSKLGNAVQSGDQYSLAENFPSNCLRLLKSLLRLCIYTNWSLLCAGIEFLLLWLFDGRNRINGNRTIVTQPLFIHYNYFNNKRSMDLNLWNSISVFLFNQLILSIFLTISYILSLLDYLSLSPAFSILSSPKPMAFTPFSHPPLMLFVKIPITYSTPPPPRRTLACEVISRALAARQTSWIELGLPGGWISVKLKCTSEMHCLARTCVCVCVATLYSAISGRCNYVRRCMSGLRIIVASAARDLPSCSAVMYVCFPLGCIAVR